MMWSLVHNLFSSQCSIVYLTVISFCSGALLTLAFAPFNFILAAICSLLLFICLIDLVSHRELWRRFYIGFWYGFGHFVTSLYWISYSLLFEPEKFAWLMPFSIIFIPALMAVFIGFFALFISCLIRARATRIQICFVFASTWVLIEFIRSYAIFPFPWNLLGYTGFFSIYFAQVASIIGVYGLSFLISLSAVVLYSRKWSLIIGVYSCISMCFIYGYLRMEQHHDLEKDSEKVVKLRVVQPNFQEFHFGDEEKKLDHLIRLIELSNKDGYQDREIIIWPESSYPFVVRDDDLMLKALGKLIKSHASLVFGADRYVDHYEGPKIYNSMIALDKNKVIFSAYDKNILVPFGEYIPLRRFLPFLNKIVGGEMEFSAGDQLNAILIDNLGHVIPLICFEAAFDLLYNNMLIEKALFVLNITNDLWFYDSVGPYQHFTMSRMRAIEYGLSLVRVANTGISAITDCYGRVLTMRDLNTEAVIDYNLKIKKAFAAYAQYGLRFVILAIMALIIGVNMMIVFIKREKY